MAKRGEHFSAEFKFKVVLETLREESTLAEIASKYDVTSKSVTTWKREFIENGVTIFNKNKDAKTHKNELVEKDEYIDKLHGTVGELTVQLSWLKKKCPERNTLGVQTSWIFYQREENDDRLQKTEQIGHRCRFSSDSSADLIRTVMPEMIRTLQDKKRHFSLN